MTPILRDRGLGALVAGPLETLASGFQFTEGPLWMPDGSSLFQDIKAEQTWRVGGDGTLALLRAATRGANGQTFAPGGQIVFCEQNGRRVSRMSRDGSGVAAIVERLGAQRLNSPNDIIARSDGIIFFTDPPYGVPRPQDKELPFQAVFRLDLAGQLTPIVHEGFEKPNGLALSPDEQTLYVADTANYHVRAFTLVEDGSIVPGSGRLFAKIDPGQTGGPDGLKVEAAGRLYVAAALGIWVYETDGTLVGILAVPQRPSNLAWGGADCATLFITAVDTVYRVRLRVPGQAPPFQGAQAAAEPPPPGAAASS
jgi:gluconolactonase